MSQELLTTKSGVSLALFDADRMMPMPGVPSGSVVYEINTDLRYELTDRVILTPDEATRVAFAILRDRYQKLGKVMLDLEDMCENFGLDMNDLTLEGDPKLREEKA